MRIEWVTVCRYAEMTPQGMNMLGSGIDTSTVPEFPHDVILAVGASLIGPYHEVKGTAQHSVQWTVADPTLTVVAENNFPVETQIDPAVYHHGSDGRLAFPIIVGFRAEAEGLYELRFSVNGSPTVSLSYWMQAAAPGESGGAESETPSSPG